MTQWGMLLLCAFIALGATSRLTRRQAGRAALALIVVVIAAAIVSYKTSTPTDKFIPFSDAQVYATGRPPQPGSSSNPQPGTGSSPNPTEDVTGVKAATWFTTVHSNSGSGSNNAGGGG
jgi:cell division protein FtsN